MATAGALVFAGCLLALALAGSVLAADPHAPTRSVTASTPR